jgi:diaminohydroxyphosphoribosylaminopyrimidine deaminase/5-amino-6-(5-phosphoribosylamino)uracil reductase
VTATDLAFLEACLELARGGLNSTSPNPRVGSLVVRDGRVLGRGFHVRAGEPHAEVIALRAAGAAARGADCYVSLEPCAHHGRTPPCADALTAAGVARVVAAHRDPDPRVAGRGFARLRAAGVRVDAVDLPAAREINLGYFSRIERARPWVRLKVAASLDGRTAMASGESRWITGEAARADVQRLRARSCAILTGIGTIAADDPALTVRDGAFAVEGVLRQPLRVVADSTLRIDGAARVLEPPGRVLLATAEPARPRASRLLDAGHEVVACGDERVDLRRLLSELGSRGINELLVEAGPRLTGAFVTGDLWDEIVLYLAPKLLGSGARGLAELDIDRLADARRGTIVDESRLGADIRITMRRLNGDDEAVFR